MKKLYAILPAISLLINIIPTIILRQKAHVGLPSLYAIIFFGAVIIQSFMAYVYRHKKNLFIYRLYWHDALSDEDDSTYSPEYMRSFSIMMLIKCASLPFYIPAFFFAKTLFNGAFWSLGIFAASQIGTFAVALCDDLRKAKKLKLKEAQQQKELEEQKRREEMGYFK